MKEDVAESEAPGKACDAQSGRAALIRHSGRWVRVQTAANREAVKDPTVGELPVDVRNAEPREVDHLAAVWYRSWQDAHARIVPVALTRLRTLESFSKRLQEDFRNVRVVGPPGAPVGFSIVKGDELHQLFVAAESRGTEVAAALIADAETRLAEGGVETAWLACAIGNARAARFYEKRGWRRTGNMINRLNTSAGEFLLEVWRYEKSLRRSER